MKKTEKKACVHADAEGRCANHSSNGEGAMCCGCADFREAKKDAAASPSRACAPAREGDALPDVTGEEVLRGYVDAVNGVLAVIRFGAMMLVKEACLTRETGGKPGEPAYGGGLKAWLQANVPDVNYKTAMRTKGTAEAVSAGLGVGAGLLLRALGPDPKALEEEEIEARERLIEIVHGKSERSLILWLKGGAPAPTPGGGPEAEDTGRAEEAAIDAAKRFARSVSDALKCMDNRKRNTMAKDVASLLKGSLGLKGMAWLAKVLEEAEQ